MNNAMSVGDKPQHIDGKPAAWRLGVAIVVFIALHVAIDAASMVADLQAGATIWYPPIGYLLAAFFWLGWRAAPLAAIAGLTAHVVLRNDASPLLFAVLSLTISIGVLGVTAHYARARLSVYGEHKRTRFTLDAMAAGVLAATVMAPLKTVAVIIFELGGQATPFEIAFGFWLGDTIGMATVTPIMMYTVLPYVGAWLQDDNRHNGLPFRFVPFPPPNAHILLPPLLAAGFVFAAAVWTLEYQGFDLLFILFLPACWIALTARELGESFIFIFIVGTGVALFAFVTEDATLIKLQLLTLSISMVTISITALRVADMRSQDRLAIREAEHSAVLNAIDKAGVGIAMYDRNGAITFANNALARLARRDSAQELIGREWFAFDELGKKGLEERKAQWEAFFETNVPWRGEILWRAKDGRKRYVDNLTLALPGGEAIAIMTDTTKRTIAQRKLDENRVLLETIVDNIPVAIAITDTQSRYTYINKYLSDIGDIAPETTVGKRANEVDTSPQADRLVALNDIVLQTKQQTQPEFFQVRSGKYAGTDWLVTKIPLFSRADVVDRILTVALDVTEVMALKSEREAFLKRLHQTQKMEALGQLAGGMAHELNNLLHPIGTFARALADAPGDEDAKRYAARIDDSLRTAKQIIADALSFARPSAERDVTDAAALVERTIDFLQEFAPKGVTISQSIADIPGQIQVNETQFRQVMVNLVQNAADALEGSGRIHIGYKIVAAPHNGQNDLPDGPCAVIMVKDEGEGMDEATQRKMFEPFFTTKGIGAGTGLGLSVVYGIVQGWGGGLDVSSAPGEGTEVRIFIPLSEREDHDA